jgi:hypothetical protein
MLDQQLPALNVQLTFSLSKMPALLAYNLFHSVLYAIQSIILVLRALTETIEKTVGLLAHLAVT